MLQARRKQNKLQLDALLDGYRRRDALQSSEQSQRRVLLKYGAIAVAAALLIVIHPLLLIPPALLYLILGMRRSIESGKKVKDFDRDYSAFLMSLASSVKAGSDPLQALISLKNLFQNESAVSQAIQDFERSLQQGKSENEAIREFGRGVPHPDLPLFRLAFALARKEGSSLAECLHRLSRVTRNRQSFRRKVSAAVAMQKFSAFGIAGCALIIVAMQFFSNPDAFVAAIYHEHGRFMIGAGATFIVLGIGWMLRISSRSEV